MTVASHVTETRRERVFLHSMSLLISFGISYGHNTIQVVKQSFGYETVFHLLIRQMKHYLDHFSRHCICSQISFCKQQQETTTQVTVWIRIKY